MAAAFVTHAAITPATAAQFTRTITVSGTNPVLIVGIGISDTADTTTVTGVTWSLGSGTAVEVKTQRGGVGDDTFASIWAIPAPGAGAGTVTVDLSASVPAQLDVQVWQGAHQTTPCPTGDAVASTSGTSPVTLTPTNLTANDASVGMSALTLLGNMNGVTPTQDFLDNTTAVNLQVGHATGTTGVTLAFNNEATYCHLAVRIAAAVANSQAPRSMQQFGRRRR